MKHLFCVCGQCHIWLKLPSSDPNILWLQIAYKLGLEKTGNQEILNALPYRNANTL